MSRELIGSVTGEIPFSTAYRLMALREERRNRKNIRDGAKEAKLKQIVKNIEATDRHLILGDKKHRFLDERM